MGIRGDRDSGGLCECATVANELMGERGGSGGLGVQEAVLKVEGGDEKRFYLVS